MKLAKNIKVCHLLLGAANEVAGIQRYIASLLNKNSLVIINNAPKYEKYLKEKKLNYLTYTNRVGLKKIINNTNIKIIHAHLGQAAFAAWQLKRKFPELKLIYTQHFIKPAYTNSKIYLFKRIIYRNIFNSFDKIIAISMAVKQASLERRECPIEKMVLVYNGISLPKLINKNKLAQKKIITICRLEREKRPELVFKLAELLPEYQFLLVGTGALFGKMSRRLPGNVKMVGYQKKVFPLLQKNSFFFLPSPAEPFGLVFLEALICGLPVLAFNGGAAAEIVSKREGLLLKDEKELVKAKLFIEKLTKNQELYEQYSKKAREKAKRFSLEKMSKEINQLYQDVLQ